MRLRELHVLQIFKMLVLAAAVPTFVCSALSFMASTTFAIFYVLYPPERHFRQALIVNLLISGMLCEPAVFDGNCG